MRRGLTLSEGAQLVPDGAKSFVLGQRGVVGHPALHVHHHLLLLPQNHSNMRHAGGTRGRGLRSRNRQLTCDPALCASVCSVCQRMDSKRKSDFDEVKLKPADSFLASNPLLVKNVRKYKILKL